VKKIALVVTTINVPHVLALFRAYHPAADLGIFVAGDRNTHPECEAFCKAIDAVYLSLQAQIDLDYSCSNLLGWNTDARRNIATLEALKWGADVFVFLDDDNIGLRPTCLDYFEFVIESPFSGLEVKSRRFDLGSMLYPQDEIHAVRQRGISPNTMSLDSWHPRAGAKVGVAQGTIIGHPDISAADRIGRLDPSIDRVAEVLHSGFILDPAVSRTVFNTQATAVIRELVSAMFIWPHSGTTEGIGRNADIYASLICQRIMRETGHVIHFGEPFFLQQRNEHNAIRDLRSELFAMEHIGEFVGWLDRTTFNFDLSVLERIHALYFAMAEELSWLPDDVFEAARMWCEDVERVTK
jgi:hypothetical protein